MQKNRFWQYLVGSIGLTLSIQSVASAHTGVGAPSGFWHGLGHPIGLGLDRLQPILRQRLFRSGGAAIVLGAV